MYKSLITNILVLFFVGFQSCSKELLTQDFNDVPVVEGYIKQNIPTEIHISKVTAAISEATFKNIQIEDIAVFIELNGVDYRIPYYSDGIFKDTAMMLPFIEGAEYRLHFKYGELEVEAYSTILSKPIVTSQSYTSVTITPFVFGAGGDPPSFPDPLEINWENEDNSYYLLVAEVIDEDPLVINEDDGNRPSFTFRNEPIQSNSTQFESMQFEYYGIYRLILSHIEPAYTQLYENNGNSSLNLTLPPGNIKNGYGIFTSISSDTLYLEVLEP